MQIGRISVSIFQSYLFIKHGEHLTVINQLEYFNLITECLFNVFILYYFVTVAQTKPDLERRQAMLNDEALIPDEFVPV